MLLLIGLVVCRALVRDLGDRDVATRPADRGGATDGWQVFLAVVGVGLFAAAAVGYFRLYLRRREPFVVVVTFAFVLLSEAMVVIAWARNWHVSWWEWHVLMLLAFVVIVLAVRHEWHEERFSALYLDQTLAGARDVSILFADLAGFTAFAERHARSGPRHAERVLRPHHPADGAAGGEVHQVVGDEVMVIFNKAGDQPDHAALAAAPRVPLQETAAEVARGHPDWPLSGPRSTAARCSRASWEGRAVTASTAWWATPSTWLRDWRPRHLLARWCWARRPSDGCLRVPWSSDSPTCG